jgi:hypothetical protein
MRHNLLKIYNIILKINYINRKIALHQNKLEDNAKGNSPERYFLGVKEKSISKI